MKLSRITTRNVTRHLPRVALLMMALTLGVTTVVALYLVAWAMQLDLANKIDAFGANMVIVPKSKNLSLSYGGVTLGGLQYEANTLTEEDAAKIRTIKNKENINIVAPKLLGVQDIKGKRVMIVGVNFGEELRLKKWWEIKGKAPVTSQDILLGASASNKLGLKVNDTVKLEGLSYKVSGIINRVGTQEDDLIYMDLQRAQNIFKKSGQLSLIEVAAFCSTCPIEQIVAQTSEKIPGAKVSALLQAAKSRNNLVGQFITFAVVLSVIMMVVAALIVFTNMLSSVRERRREIGIFRAMGYRRAHILQIILSESVFMSFVSGTIGYLAGFGIAKFIASGSANIDVPIELDAQLAIIAIGGAVLLSFVSSLYPAIAAAKLDPVTALEAV
ncbi:MAG: ABC transporter permease [Actinobacteria bacterium]|nr:ABC transporter permease [Actinomycetota bacterium]